MNLSRTLVALVALVSCGCTIGDFTFRDDKVEVAQDKLVVFSSAEADSVVVAPDRLTLPYAGHETLLERSVGDVLASDRGSPQGKNPFGFLRKFKSASRSGDKIIVLTESSTMTDVVRSGTVYASLPSSGSPSSPVKSWAEPVGQNKQGLEFETSKMFEIPSKDIPISFKGKTITLKLSGSVGVKKAALVFDPTFDLGLQIVDSQVKEFHAIAKGQVSTQLDLEAKGTVSWDKTLTDQEPASQIEEIISKAVEAQSGLQQTTPLWSTSVMLPTWFIGPVPVVTDLNVTLDLECKVAVQASLTVTYTLGTKGSFSGGIQLLNDKWSPVNSSSFQPFHQGPDFLVGGGVKLECGLKPSLQLRFYGAIGPYLFFKAYGSAEAELETKCGSTPGYPSCGTTVYGSAGVTGGVGAKIDIGVLGLKFQKDLGELELFNLKLLDRKPILGPLDFGSCPLGYCSGSSSCGNSLCEDSENCSSCPQDCSCAATCPNAVCDGTEDCVSCPLDCGECAQFCGNQKCEYGETCVNCQGDCGECPIACGDSTCNSTENCSTCPQDCSCSAGQKCDSGTCCQMHTCEADYPGVCGEAYDGCGGLMTCQCPTGQSCNVTACCLPLTCADLGGKCGDFSDGCGGTISCNCGDGYYCCVTCNNQPLNVCALMGEVCPCP